VFADLHLHTFHSDGTYTPEELAARAAEHGLHTIALTDHDTLEGCAATEAACRRLGVEFIPAVELTCELDGTELHLLAYGVNVRDAELLAALNHFQQVRQDRIRQMVGRLNALEVPLEVSAVFALANCRAPGRLHVGRALVEGGFCPSVDVAFERFLKRHRPAWVPKFKLSASEAIELVHRAGGLAVMAHPVLNQLDARIPDLAARGLDGLECYHSKHTPKTVTRYLALARRLDLLVTGGSDCHGMAKGKPTIGTVKLPAEHLERLNAALAARHDPKVQPAPNPKTEALAAVRATGLAVPHSALPVPR
jgi:predicted metal-dependent phosphoesterase TrpH